MDKELLKLDKKKELTVQNWAESLNQTRFKDLWGQSGQSPGRAQRP